MTYAQYLKRTDNGDSWTTTDDCPDWLYDAIYEAHDGELPNDWRYDTIRHILSMIDDGAIDPDDDDTTYGAADTLVDIYTSDRLAWLAGDIERAEYVNDACREFGNPEKFDVVESIGLGQYQCIRQMIETICEAISENQEE